MILSKRTGALLCAALMFCPTVGIEVAQLATQATEDSKGWQIPDGAAMEHNPEPLNAATLARGQSVYKAKCQRCHGTDGTGHGPEADPSHPAGNLTDRRLPSRNPDGVMFYKVWNGRKSPKMPAFKSEGLSKDEVWTVIRFVNTLRK